MEYKGCEIDPITDFEVNALLSKMRMEGFPDRCMMCYYLHLEIETGACWCDEDDCKGWKELFKHQQWG